MTLNSTASTPTVADKKAVVAFLIGVLVFPLLLIEHYAGGLLELTLAAFGLLCGLQSLRSRKRTLAVIGTILSGIALLVALFIFFKFIGFL